MSNHPIPHFHNEPGVPIIQVGVKEFMCMGALPPLDHPHVYLDMGEDATISCPYCSTLFEYVPSLGTKSLPSECLVEEGSHTP